MIRPSPLRSRVVLCAVMCVTCVTLGIAVFASLKIGYALCALAAIGVVGFLCATPSGVRFLAGLLVASTFVSRFKFAVLGLHFRLEDGVVLAALLALMISRTRQKPLGNVVADRTTVLLAMFVLWLGVVSIAQAPDPQRSLAIVGWLALDVLILVVLVAAFEGSSQLEDAGVKWACLAFAIADVLYVIGPHIGFGVQPEPGSGTHAAYGLSYEANILASTAAMWLFIAMTSPKSRAVRTYRLLIPLAFVTLIVSFTRAADVALAVGLLIWATLEGGRARRVLFLRLGVLLVGAALILSALPAFRSQVTHRLSQVTEIQTGTGRDRIKASAEALNDLSSPASWLFGLGANSFGQRHRLFTRPEEEVSGYLGVLPLQSALRRRCSGALPASRLVRVHSTHEASAPRTGLRACCHLSDRICDDKPVLARIDVGDSGARRARPTTDTASGGFTTLACEPTPPAKECPRRACL